MRFAGIELSTSAALCALAVLSVGSEPARAVGWSPEYQSLIVGDYDGDGADDLFVLPRTSAWPCELITSSTDGTLDTLAQLWESDDCLGTGSSGHEFAATSGNFDGTLGDDLLLLHRETASSFVYHADGSGDVAGVLTLGQQLPAGAFGFAVTGDTHRALSGRFSADGNADLLLQGAERPHRHGLAQATLQGTFVEAAPTWVDADGYLGFVWSDRQVALHVGDFNGDGADDLLMVPSRVPIAAPSGGQLTLVSRSVQVLAGDGMGGFATVERILPKNLPFDWAPDRYHLIVADFNGDGFDDVFLQAVGEGQDSYLLVADAIGGRLATGTVSKITDGEADTRWSTESFVMVAGDFSGTSTSQLYKLATAPGIPNELVTFTATGSISSVASHTPPTVPAPMPTNIAAATAGTGTVGASGAAAYSVPLFTPAGTAGMVPQLALRYSSESGNGFVGVGWSLDGLSRITRCLRTIVHDGDVGAVSYAAEDRFCLDGQRLLLSSGDGYGAHGAEYRTEVDSFVRVRSFDDGGQRTARFEVDLPNGERLTYGASADSRIEAGTSDGVGPVRAWALTTRCDRFDNCIEYRYDERLTSGEYYPEQILYTQSPSVAPLGHYRVLFQWQLRPAQDVLEGYVAGYRHRLSQRLASLRVEYRDDATDAAPWTLVRAYDLAYHQRVVGGSGRSRLAYVQEHAASDGNDVRHLPPIRFDWQVGTAGWAPVAHSAQAIADIRSVRIGDVNNDGFQDIVSAGASTWQVLLGDAQGTLTPTLSDVSTLDADYTFLADFDGDGTDDLLRPQEDRWWLYLSTESRPFSTAIDTGLTAEGVRAGGVIVTDLTGDRLPDLVYAQDGVIRLRANTGSGFSSTIAAEFVEGLALDGDGDYLSALREARLLDFDGDGRHDVLARVVSPPDSAPEWVSPAGEFQQLPFTLDWQGGSTAWELMSRPYGGQWSDPVYYAQSAQVFEHEDALEFRVRGRNEVGQTGPWSDIRSHQFVHFDGGGVGEPPPPPPYERPSQAEWQVVRYDGSSIGLFATLGTIDSPLPLDLNGDGRTDVAYVDETGHWATRVSTGVAFEAEVQTEIDDTTDRSPFVVDYNRDGRQDLAFADDSAEYVVLRVALSNGVGLEPWVVVREIDDRVFLGSIREPGRIRTVDVNGDGYPGVAIYSVGESTWHVDEQVSTPADLMTRATDGVENFVEFEYAPLSHVNADINPQEIPDVLDDEALSAPVSRVYRGPRRVVTSRRANDGASGSYRVDYTYGGAILNTHGRGFQGFRRRTMVDSRELPWAEFWHQRAFPFTGRTALSLTYQPQTDRPIASVHARWDSKLHAYPQVSTHVVFPATVTSERREVSTDPAADGVAFLTSTQSVAAADVDVYGFGETRKVTSVVSSPIAGEETFTTVVETAYDTRSSLEDHCILPTRVTVRRSSDGDPVGEVRTTAYPTYDLTTCRMDGSDLNADAAERPHEALHTRLTRDALGNVTQVEAWESGAPRSSSRLTKITYDERGQFPIEVARGPGADGGDGVRLTDDFTWQYDLGLVKTSTTNAHPVDGTGPTASLAYDALGRVTTLTDVDGSRMRTRYEWCEGQGGCALPNATFQILTDIDYFPQDGVDRRAAGAERTILDAFGRVIGAFTDHGGAPGELPGGYREFDDRGFIKRATSAPIAYHDTAYFDDYVALPTYDVLGRVLSHALPTKDDDNATTTTTYRGLQTEQADNRGAVWRYTRDVLGRVVRVDNPDPLTGAFGAGATATHYTYTQFDELHTVTDPEHHQTRATYNGLGLRETLDDPNSGTWQFQHNAFGDLVQQVSPRQAVEGSATRWHYDRLGRMTQRVEVEGTTYWRYYDSVDDPWRGMLQEVEYPVSLLAAQTRIERYTYDHLTRLSQWRDLGSDTSMALAYDGVSRVHRITYPQVAGQPFAIDYDYDERSRVSSVTSHEGRLLYRAHTFDRFGRVTDFDLGNGVKVGAETDRAVGAVTGLLDAAAGRGAIQHFTYDWDASGNTIARHDLKHGVSDDFAYDYMNALTAHTVIQANGGYTDEYVIGPTGNLEHHPVLGTYDYLASAPHQLTSTSVVAGTPEVTYAYDANGNQTTRHDAQRGSTDTHTWASFDLPTELTHDGATAQFDYGAYRELVAVRRTDRTGRGETSEYFTELVERDTRDGEVAHKFHVFVEGRRIAQERVDDTGERTTEYFHYDHQGSVTALTSATGQVLEEYRYEPYGKRRHLDGAKDLTGTLTGALPGRTQFGYTGHEQVDVVGLIHMRGRVYDPGLGRMLSVDPVMRDALNQRSHNGYSYVEGNPATYTDPTGFSSEPFSIPAPTFIDTIGFMGGANSLAPDSLTSAADDQLGFSIQVNIIQLAGFSGQTDFASARIQRIARASSYNSYMTFVEGVIAGQFGASLRHSNGGHPIGPVFSNADQVALVKQGGSLALDVTPVVGGVKGGIQVVTGRDLVTDEPVDRWGEAIGAALGIFGLRFLAKVDDAVDSGRAVAKAADAAPTSSATVARIRSLLARYPQIVDPRTGRAITFPTGITQRVPAASRVPWGARERGEFIAEWHRRGFPEPRGGWQNYDIHHIQPREFGGSNNFLNLVPVERGTHQSQFNAFWREFSEL